MSLPKVFIGWARAGHESADRNHRWLDGRRTHRHPLETSDALEVFPGEAVGQGAESPVRIQRPLRKFSVLVLVVSAAFLASKFVTHGELPILRSLARDEGFQRVPILRDPRSSDLIAFQQSAQTQGRVAGISEVPASGSASPTPKAAPMEFTNSLGMRFVPVAGVDAWFCIWPTRVRDYAAFAEATPGLDPSWRDPVYEGVPVTPGPNHPVVAINWAEAAHFCRWLTEKEQGAGRLRPGRRYRLPTDLEWSAAVGLPRETGATPLDRDGKIGNVYPWGAQWPPPPGSGNFADITAGKKFPKWRVIEGYDDGFATASPVGSFRPSAAGLYDMAGNVWEWCEDWYDNEQKSRVLRGGSWFGIGPRGLLSSGRSDFGPVYRNCDIGFRVVLAGDGSVRPGGL